MSKRRNYGSMTVSCDVDVDIADAVAEMTDAEIRQECTARGIATDGGATEKAEERAEYWRDFADELRRVMASGDRLHMEVLIVRMLVMADVPRLKIKLTA